MRCVGLTDSIRVMEWSERQSPGLLHSKRQAFIRLQHPHCRRGFLIFRVEMRPEILETCWEPSRCTAEPARGGEGEGKGRRGRAGRRQGHGPGSGHNDGDGMSPAPAHQEGPLQRTEQPLSRKELPSGSSPPTGSMRTSECHLSAVPSLRD